ncbi:MAG: P-II family nitrogen regulator [Halothiobacillaceae bacterium]
MAVDLYPEKMVTIVVSTSLEERMKRTIRASEASGFTYFTVRGEGESGPQTGHLAGDSSTMFLVVLSESKLDGFLSAIKRLKACGHHATVFVGDTQVMNPVKY